MVDKKSYKKIKYPWVMADFWLVVFVWIVTLRPVANFINTFFVEKGLWIFLYDIDNLYNNPIHLNVAGYVFTALVAFFIPPLLKIYSFCNDDQNILLKKDIERNYGQGFIAKLLVFVMLFWFSCSVVFSVLLSLTMAHNLYDLFRVYLSFLFGKYDRIKKLLEELLRESLRKLNSFYNLQKKIDKIKEEIFQDYIFADNGPKEEYAPVFIFESNDNVVKYDDRQLKKFCREIYIVVKEHHQGSPMDIRQVSGRLDGEAERDKPFYFEIGCNEERRRIFLRVYASKDFSEGNLCKELYERDSDFCNSFRYEGGYLEQDLEDYFKSLFGKVVGSLKKNNEYSFKKELDCLTVLVKQEGFAKNKKYTRMLWGIIQKFQKYEDEKKAFEHHHKKEIFELWKKIFFSAEPAGTEFFAGYGTYILLNGIKTDFWKEV